MLSFILLLLRGDQGNICFICRQYYIRAVNVYRELGNRLYFNFVQSHLSVFTKSLNYDIYSLFIIGLNG